MAATIAARSTSSRPRSRRIARFVATISPTGSWIAIPSGATLAPGGSIGTLNVTGNLSIAAGSFYQVEVNAAGANSKTVATGTATIAGGTVHVIEQPGAYSPTNVYTILTANGGRTGTFAGATSDFAFLTPTLTYDANDAFLTLTRNATFFSSLKASRIILSRNIIRDRYLLDTLNQRSARDSRFTLRIAAS